jgi:hypothetical protein
MESTHAIRSSSASRRSGIRLITIIAGVLLAACAAPATPTAAPFTADPCSLITTADLEAAFGTALPAASPGSDHESATDSSCRWTLQSSSNPAGDHLTLDVKAPGGKADFSSVRQFLAGLPGEPGGSGFSGASDTPGASDGPTFGSVVTPAGSGISLPSLPGVGDDAFIGAAGTVYALKGDAEVTLQLIALDDPRAQQDTIDLIKKALDRLP